MRQTIFLFLTCIMTFSLNAQSFVDLGLPSGTKWKSENEHEFYTYDNAILKFYKAIPSEEQWKELKKMCQWKWTGNGYKVTGPNGNTIFLPAAGYKECTSFSMEPENSLYNKGASGCYWSSKLNSDTEGLALFMNFNSTTIEMEENSWCMEQSVRIVLNEEKSTSSSAKYIDLGLSSGTKWKSVNEPGLYTFDEAVSKFDNQLPSIEQWEELKSECQWTRIDYEFIVKGPNGNTITLPAEGSRSCFGATNDVGAMGIFWSSKPENADQAWSLYFNWYNIDIYYFYKCNGNSVRLVKGRE